LQIRLHVRPLTLWQANDLVHSWHRHHKPLKKGLTGVKPEPVCEWILDFLNWQPGDEVDDLFPGTGVMGRVVLNRADMELAA
jgi:hypothetical protein